MTELRVRGLTKRYGGVEAVTDLDLDVAPASRTAIVGPSGSGKSTLLRLIAGFETPDAGTIMLGDTLLAGPAGVLPAHRRGIGIVTQDGSLFPHLSIAENIGFGLTDRTARPSRVAELMEAVELPRSMAERRPHQLSGGQQQRVALARALACSPGLMLLDEPFSALDAGLRHSIREVVGRVLQQSSIASILVTHDQAEALSFADQIAVIRDGCFAQVGTPEDLYLRPRDPDTALLVGEAIILRGTIEAGGVRCLLGFLDANTGGRRGPASIMLRPEQVTLAPLTLAPGDTSPSAPAGTFGIVRRSSFQGGVSDLQIEILDRDPEGSGDGVLGILRLACPSLGAPPPGASVAIKVTGKAHLFEQAPTPALRMGPPTFT